MYSSRRSTAIGNRFPCVDDLPWLTIFVLLLLTLLCAHAFPYNYKDENVRHEESGSGRRIFDTPPISRADDRSSDVANRYDEKDSGSSRVPAHKQQPHQQLPSDQPPPPAFSGRRIFPPNEDEAPSPRFGLSSVGGRRIFPENPTEEPSPKFGLSSIGGRRIFPDNPTEAPSFRFEQPSVEARRTFPDNSIEAPSFRFGPPSVGGRRIFPDNPTDGDDRPRRKTDTSRGFFDHSKDSVSETLHNTIPDASWDGAAYDDGNESDESSDSSSGPAFRMLFKDNYDDASLEDYSDDYPQARFRMFY